MCATERTSPYMCVPAHVCSRIDKAKLSAKVFVLYCDTKRPASTRHKWSLNESVIYSKLWYVRFAGSFWVGQRGRRYATVATH